jgi:signal transduction histidine kinase
MSSSLHKRLGEYLSHAHQGNSPLCISAPKAQHGNIRLSINAWFNNWNKPHVLNLFDIHATNPQPYYPVPHIIANNVKRLDIKLSNLLEHTVYKPHVNLWTGLIQNTVLDFPHDFIPQEYEYNKYRLNQDFITLIEQTLPKAPLITVISGIESATSATLHWLKIILTHNWPTSVKIIFISASENSENHKNPEWDRFQAFLEEQFSCEFTPVEPFEQDSTESPISAPTAADACHKHLVAFAARDAVKFGRNSLTEFSPTDAHSHQHRIMLLNNLGDALFYSADFHTALLTYEEALNNAQSTHDPHLLARCYLKLYHLMACLNDNHSAQEYAHQCLKFARATHDEILLLDCLFPLTGWGEYFGHLLSEIEFNWLLQATEKYQRTNWHAYVLRKTRMFLHNKNDYATLIRNTENSVSLCQRINNEYSLAHAYHELGIAYAKQEHSEEAIEFHIQSLELHKKLQDRVAVVGVSNGAGYLYSTLGRFSEAITQYQHSIPLLPRLNNWGEIGATLYNIGHLYFLVRDFKQANRIFDQLFEIMQILEVDRFVFHTRARVAALLGICLIKSGAKLRAIRLYNIANSKFIQDAENEETQAYISMLSALIAHESSNPEHAKIQLQSAIEKIRSAPRSDQRLLTYLHGEYTQILKHTASSEETKAALAEAKRLCRFYQQHWLSGWLQSLLQEHDERPIYDLPEIAPNTIALVELARRDSEMAAIHRYRMDEQLRQKVQELSRLSSIETLASRYTTTLHELINVDIILLYRLGPSLEILALHKPPSIETHDNFNPKQIIDFCGMAQQKKLHGDQCRELKITTNKAISTHFFAQYPAENPIQLIMVKLNTDHMRNLQSEVVTQTLDQVALFIDRSMKDKLLRESLTDKMALSEKNAILETRLSDFDVALRDAYYRLEQQHQALEQQHDKYVKMQQQVILAEKMSGLNTLVAGIAHEINNPTNFIAMGSSNLKAHVNEIERMFNELADPEEAELLEPFTRRFQAIRTQLKAVEEGATRIRDIVAAIKTFSRSENSTDSIIACYACVQSAMELVRSSFKHDVEFLLDGPDFLIKGSAASFTQALTNIMINGCQAIKRRAQRFHSDAKGTLQITTHLIGATAELCIRDNGCGIPETVTSRVIEPFFTTLPTGQGQGLGLSTAFAIIEEMHGSLEIKSIEHEGTSVTIRLPLLEN